MQQMCFIRHLQLSKCNLSEQSIDLLVSAMEKSAYDLAELDISANSLASPSMLKMLRSLENNESLQTLSLAWNDLGQDADITPLKRFIRRNTNLTHIDLSGLLHSKKQVVAIIKAVKNSLSLQSLHLNYTSVINPCIRTYIQE